MNCEPRRFRRARVSALFESLLRISSRFSPDGAMARTISTRTPRFAISRARNAESLSLITPSNLLSTLASLCSTLSGAVAIGFFPSVNNRRIFRSEETSKVATGRGLSVNAEWIVASTIVRRDGRGSESYRDGSGRRGSGRTEGAVGGEDKRGTREHQQLPGARDSRARFSVPRVGVRRTSPQAPRGRRECDVCREISAGG